MNDRLHNVAQAAAPMSAPQLAKAALRRLALGQLEPTPENYARAWAQEAGTVPSAAEPAGATAQQWALLIEGLLRGLERTGQWTVEQKKVALRRVLDLNRNDVTRLHERLRRLASSWGDGAEGSQIAPLNADADVDTAEAAARQSAVLAPAWGAVVSSLESALDAALPGNDERARALADQLGSLAERIERGGADAVVAADIEQRCAEARKLLTQRHELVDQLSALARELTAGLTELAEDDSWARGQAEAMLARLGPVDGSAPLSVRNVRATHELLAQTRRQQKRLKGERDRARDALKSLVQSLATELGDLGGRTGQFTEQLGAYADGIEQADSLEGLASLVHEMVQESRSVQSQVADASSRLQAGQAEADSLSSRVRELEGELRRLSDEVAVDALTQVANRRGLAQAFETESARHAHDGKTLAVALIDIDNFKKLNDSLGHLAGDEALKALAARVRDALRPIDHVARFGGEEFVMLLPATEIAPAQEALTRLQRDLTVSLFMHEGRDVFVTFSGGVTAWRVGESLDAAIERADEALYEAKRTGKNRTCVA